MTFSCCVESIVGPLTVVSDESVVTAIRFGRMLDNGDDAVRPDVLRQAVQELNDFFVGKRHVFTVPVGPVGTLFQQEVWAALRAIPYGETRSYRDIARAVGRPAACRAVGWRIMTIPFRLSFHAIGLWGQTVG